MYLLSLSLTVGAARLTSANRVCLVAMLAAWLRLRSWLFRSGDWMTLTVCRQASKALSVSAPQRLLKRLACRWVEARRHARRAKTSARSLPRSAGRAKSLRAKPKSGVRICSYACVRLFCTGSRSPQLPLPTSLDLRAHVRVRWEHSPSVSCLMSSIMQALHAVAQRAACRGRRAVRT